MGKCDTMGNADKTICEDSRVSVAGGTYGSFNSRGGRAGGLYDVHVDYSMKVEFIYCFY